MPFESIQVLLGGFSFHEDLLVNGLCIDWYWSLGASSWVSEAAFSFMRSSMLCETSVTITILWFEELHEL